MYEKVLVMKKIQVTFYPPERIVNGMERLMEQNPIDYVTKSQVVIKAVDQLLKRELDEEERD